jgi:hypothetical protein
VGQETSILALDSRSEVGHANLEGWLGTGGRTVACAEVGPSSFAIPSLARRRDDFEVVGEDGPRAVELAAV